MNVLTPEQCESFRRNGFHLLEGACTNEVADLRARVDDYYARRDPSATFRFGPHGEITHFKIPKLADNDVAFRNVAQSARVSGALEDLIGSARIFRDVLIAKPARNGAVVRFHQDIAYWDVSPPDLVVSAWVALDDASEEAGCLEVVAGSHDRLVRHGLALGSIRIPDAVAQAMRKATSLTGTGDNPRTNRERFFASAKEAVLGGATKILPVLGDLNDFHIADDDVPPRRRKAIPAKAGDVIFFESRLVHGSGPNTSASPRRAYIVSYMSENCRVSGRTSDQFLPARA